MVTHLVLFKLRDPSPANLTATAAVLEEMDGKVPALESMEVGVDVVRSERSYDLALVTRFQNWEGLEAYRVHPVHGKVLTHLQRVVVSSIVVDYEG
jgi:hypothetical protein